MTRRMCLLLILVGGLAFPNASAWCGASLYDDFSGTYINQQKWKDVDLVREVAGGKLVSKVHNSTDSQKKRSDTSIANPLSVNIIECKIKIVSTLKDTGSNASSFARINGFFYNKNGSGGATGDIWAGISIGNRGSGLEAWWEIDEALNDELTNFKTIDSDTLIGSGTLSPGTEYAVKLEYNGNNGFTFTANGKSSGLITSGPARLRTAVTEHKSLATGAYGSNGDGYASATFDDVFINNNPTAYDNFSTAPLNSTRWDNLESVAELSGGKLRLNAQAKDLLGQAQCRPKLNGIDYLETKVQIDSGSWVSTGANGIARIGGYYYNDTYSGSYNAYEGNVFVQFRISLDDLNNLKGLVFMGRQNSAIEDANFTTFYSGQFSKTLAFNTEYTISIQRIGYQFIFKLNNETLSYTVTTAMYDPYNGQQLQLRSRVYADTGESGYIKAYFDDVKTGTAAAPGVGVIPAINLLLLN